MKKILMLSFLYVFLTACGVNDYKNEVQMKSETDEKIGEISSAESSTFELECNSIEEAEGIGTRIEYEINGELYSLTDVFYPDAGQIVEYKYEIADLTGDGREELLVSVYYSQNICDGVCSSKIYEFDDNGKEIGGIFIDDFMPKGSVYCDVSVIDDHIEFERVWKENGIILTELLKLCYSQGDWKLQ